MIYEVQIVDLQRRCCDSWLCYTSALQNIKGCCDYWRYFHHKYTKCKGCCGCWRLRWAHVSCKSTWFWLLTIYEVQIIDLQRRCCDSWLFYTSALQNIKHRCDCWRYFHHKYTKCKGCCGCWRLRWAHVPCKSTWFWLLTIYEVQIIDLQRRCCDSWLFYTPALQNITGCCDYWRYFHHKYIKCKGCCNCWRLRCA